MSTSAEGIIIYPRATKHPKHILDSIMENVSITDLRTMFFLLIDTKITREDFLNVWVKEDQDALKNEFLNIYNGFYFKDAFLIEIFGTMGKYYFLLDLGTCIHIFYKDKETFTQLSSLWKSLCALCQHIQISFLKEQLFPENPNVNVCCAEELICLAFVKGKLEENSWQKKLRNVCKHHFPSCLKLIDSYKSSYLNYYPLRRPNAETHCGIAIILNITCEVSNLEDRPDSYSDANALKELWESFGFKTAIITDLNAWEIFQLFKNLAKENHSKYDAFVACILSHGDDGIVIAKNHTGIRLSVLVDLIANECETLLGKPKLFFVDACQGLRIQAGSCDFIHSPNTRPNILILELKASMHPFVSDVLIFNSSIEGFPSFLSDGGSWFVDTLVSNLNEHAENLPLSNILTKITNDVTKKKDTNPYISHCRQTPVQYNTLQYELKLKKAMYCNPELLLMKH